MRVEYPGFGVMRFPQGTLHENTPLEQHVDPSSVMSCTKSEQDVLSSQIKTEVNDDQAYQSSLEVKVEREEYSNLEGIVSNQLR